MICVKVKVKGRYPGLMTHLKCRLKKHEVSYEMLAQDTMMIEAEEPGDVEAVLQWVGHSQVRYFSQPDYWYIEVV